MPSNTRDIEPDDPDHRIGERASVRATGTVVSMAGRCLLVPTGLADADEPTAADAAVAHGDPASEFALVLRGENLPAAGTRVTIEGSLAGRSFRVVRWESEPPSTSAWAVPVDVDGVAPDAADAVIEDVPESWPLISLGVSRTVAGHSVAVIEVEQATPEIEAWVRSQPPGSVRLVTFIALA